MAMTITTHTYLSCGGKRGARVSKVPALSSQPCSAIHGIPVGDPHSLPAITPHGTGMVTSLPLHSVDILQFAAALTLSNLVTIILLE